MSSIHKERSERPQAVLASMMGWALICIGGCSADSSPELSADTRGAGASSSAGHADRAALDAPLARVVRSPSSSNDDEPIPPDDDPGESGNNVPAADSGNDPAAPGNGDPNPPSDVNPDEPMDGSPAMPMDGDSEGPGTGSDQPVIRVPAAPTDISSTADVSAGETFEVREETYALPDLQFTPPDDLTSDLRIPVEMLGVIVAPVNAPGPRPVAVFIHGQHASCYSESAGEGTGGWPCPEGSQTVPSYRGFLSYQRFLASAGWVTLSVSANGISGHAIAQNTSTDTSLRTQLVEAHLRQWDAWITGNSTVQAPAVLGVVKPDLQRLLLVGHSRGGSTANQVALNSVTVPTSPWRVRAQVLIGPTVENYNPAPTVPVVVLLPGCDGDVTDMQGQSYIDRAVGFTADSALRTSVFIAGANHDFFNSEWDPSTATAKGAAKDDAAALFETETPADGAPAVRALAGAALEGACRPGAPARLGGEQQRELGTFFIAVAAKALVEGEDALLPLVDGSLVCSGPSCDPHIVTHALGGLRQPVLIPSADSVASGSPFVPCLTARNSGANACITANMPRFKDRPRTPHFGSAITGQATQEPTHTALRMDWNASSTPAASTPASIRLNRPVLDQDVSQLDVRVIVAPDAVDTTFALSLVDSSGQELSLGSVAMTGVPANAGGGAGVYWAQNVRLPLDRSAKFDFSTLEQLRITPKSASGLIWVLDAWGYKPGPATPSGSPARFELTAQGSAVDANGATHVTGNVFGELREDAEIYYYVPDEGETGIEGTLRIAAGSRSFDLPLRVPAGATGPLGPQLLGIKGIVPTRRQEYVTLPPGTSP